MVIGTAAGLHNAATAVLSIVLAFVFGYALTMRGGWVCPGRWTPG